MKENGYVWQWKGVCNEGMLYHTGLDWWIRRDTPAYSLTHPCCNERRGVTIRSSITLMGHPRSGAKTPVQMCVRKLECFIQHWLLLVLPLLLEQSNTECLGSPSKIVYGCGLCACMAMIAAALLCTQCGWVCASSFSIISLLVRNILAFVAT